MDAMKLALKAKRKGGLMGGSQEGSSSVKELLMSLGEDEKEELKMLLMADEEKTPSNKVQMGEPSSEEKAKIDTMMAAEEMSDEAEDEMDGAVDSDEIAMGMLDSRFKNADPSMKPRNLSERVKMSMASKLKAKGKI